VGVQLVRSACIQSIRLVMPPRMPSSISRGGLSDCMAAAISDVPVDVAGPLPALRLWHLFAGGGGAIGLAARWAWRPGIAAQPELDLLHDLDATRGPGCGDDRHQPARRVQVDGADDHEAGKQRDQREPDVIEVPLAPAGLPAREPGAGTPRPPHYVQAQPDRPVKTSRSAAPSRPPLTAIAPAKNASIAAAQ
jgi:hypothetical protein